MMDGFRDCRPAGLLGNPYRVLALFCALGAFGCASSSSPFAFTESLPDAGHHGDDAGLFDASQPPGDAPTSAPSCKVDNRDDNATLVACTQKAPPNSFAPKVKWTWSSPAWKNGDLSQDGSLVTPLVGN